MFHVCIVGCFCKSAELVAHLFVCLCSCVIRFNEYRKCWSCFKPASTLIAGLVINAERLRYVMLALKHTACNCSVKC